MFRIPKPDKPAWPGPVEGGITQSLINLYLDCPFRFYIYTVLGLEDPENINPNLIYGSIAHRGLEHIIPHQVPVKDFSPEDKKELLDVLLQYTNDHYPSAPASFPYSACEMCMLYDDEFKLEDNFQTEVKFEIPYTTPSGSKVTLRGKVDGLGSSKIVEHKFVGFNDPMKSRLETPIDLQVNLYMYVTGTEECIYDKIKIPDTNNWAPARRQMERPAKWVERLFHEHHYKEYPIARNKHLWLDQFRFFRFEEQKQEYINYIVNPLLDNICDYWEYVTSPSFDPNDPKCYNHLFWVKPIRTFDASRTEKYKCNYYNFLAGEMALDDLRPTTFYAELIE